MRACAGGVPSDALLTDGYLSMTAVSAHGQADCKCKVKSAWLESHVCQALQKLTSASEADTCFCCMSNASEAAAAMPLCMQEAGKKRKEKDQKKTRKRKEKEKRQAYLLAIAAFKLSMTAYASFSSSSASKDVSKRDLSPHRTHS